MDLLDQAHLHAQLVSGSTVKTKMLMNTVLQQMVEVLRYLGTQLLFEVDRTLYGHLSQVVLIR